MYILPPNTQAVINVPVNQKESLGLLHSFEIRDGVLVTVDNFMTFATITNPIDQEIKLN